MPLPAGTRLDSYEIVSPVGAGGMGEVYRARDTALKRDVALKILPDFWSRDPERLRRFDLEAQAAATLNHPNVVSIFHVGRYNGRPISLPNFCRERHSASTCGKVPCRFAKCLRQAAASLKVLRRPMRRE